MERGWVEKIVCKGVSVKGSKKKVERKTGKGRVTDGKTEGERCECRDVDKGGERIVKGRQGVREAEVEWGRRMYKEKKSERVKCDKDGERGREGHQAGEPTVMTAIA